MDKFFLGVITGLGSLVVPLLLASLFLPGPPGTNLENAGTFPQDDDSKHTVEETEAGWRVHTFGEYGFSINTPANWHLLEFDELPNSSLNPEETFILMTIDHPDPEIVRAVLNVRVIDQAAEFMLPLMPEILEDVREESRVSTVVQEIAPAILGPYFGASFTVRSVTKVQGDLTVTETHIWLMAIGDKSVILRVDQPAGLEGAAERELTTASVNSLSALSKPRTIAGLEAVETALGTSQSSQDSAPATIDAPDLEGPTSTVTIRELGLQIDVLQAWDVVVGKRFNAGARYQGDFRRTKLNDEVVLAVMHPQDPDGGTRFRLKVDYLQDVPIDDPVVFLRAWAGARSRQSGGQIFADAKPFLLGDLKGATLTLQTDIEVNGQPTPMLVTARFLKLRDGFLSLINETPVSDPDADAPILAALKTIRLVEPQ